MEGMPPQKKLRSNKQTRNMLVGQFPVFRAGATSPVGQVSTGPLFCPSALTADLGDYDVRGSIDERSTGSTELAA